MAKITNLLFKSALVIGILGTTQLAAAAENGLYIGGSLGHSSIGLDDDDFDVDIGDFDLDDNDIGYKLFAGYKFGLLSVEGGYVDFGKIDETSFEAEVSGFDVFGMLTLGLGPIDVFGKFGGFIWQSDVEALEDSYDEDGFDPAAGIGASFALGGLAFRAEYEYFDVSDFDEVAMLSLGATFNF